MARAKSISIPVTGNTAPLRKALKEAQKDLTAFGKAQQQWAAASSLAYGIAGSAVAQFAADSVRAAIEDQKSQAILAKQLQITTGARDAQISAVEDYIGATMMATNVTDDQLRPALAQLVRVTGSASEAQNLLTLATDVSIGAGRDLSSVVTALSRAYNGSTGSLSKLGIAVDESAVKARGFAAVADELNEKFGGQAAAAMDTTAGRVENLGVRFDELKETIGTTLLPALEEVVGGLADIAEGIQNVDFAQLGSGAINLGGFFNKLSNPAALVASRLYDMAKNIDLNASEADILSKKMKALSGILVADYEIYKQSANVIEDQADAAARAEREVGYLRDQYRQLSQITLQFAEDEKKRAAEAETATKNARAEAAERRANYQSTAKGLRETLGRALDDSRQKLVDAKEAADEFGQSLAYSFGVSLAGAYDKANDAERDYTDALNARKDAYTALDVAKQGDDLNAYLKALQDVKTAEEGVTAAQTARITPAAAFASQIADAKNFGANLKTLIGQGLGESGLRQLLDLGPTAGAQVTKELLAGTAGFTVGELNASLAALSDVQAGLAGGITSALAPTAAISAAQSQVDALSSASIGAPGVGQGFTIIVNAGVGDPVAIGAQVKSVLQSYDQRAGKLTVQGPKKKGKR